MRALKRDIVGLAFLAVAMVVLLITIIKTLP